MELYSPNFVSNIMRSVRVCVHCGAVGTLGFLLCSGCEIKLSKSQNSNWRAEYILPVLSLYSWGPSNDEMARRIAQGLKGGGAVEIFAALARNLTTSRLMIRPLLVNTPTVFIPAPGVNPNGLDHAEMLAMCLAQASGGLFLRALERAKPHSQKTKTEQERKMASTTLKLSAQYAGMRQIEFDDNSPIVFVDDIITTGQTAQAAYNELNRPKNFEIWTVFNRLRLRP